MKNLIFLMAGLIFALSSCSDNNYAPASEENLSVSELSVDETLPDSLLSTDENSSDSRLSVLATRSEIIDPEKDPLEAGGGEITPPDSYEEHPVVFSGEDVKSFNLTSREIVFDSEEVAGEIRNRMGVCDKLMFYLDDELLFEASIYTPISGWIYLDLTLVKEETGMFLYDSYPRNWTWDDAQNEELQENIQKRKPAWDKFVKFLSDAGKIVE